MACLCIGDVICSLKFDIFAVVKLEMESHNNGTMVSCNIFCYFVCFFCFNSNDVSLSAHASFSFQVQPGPPPCPVFYPEKQEITLPSDGLWVLRFPYAYVTERGPCFPPKESQQLMSYKVLRGILKAVTQ